MIPPIIDSKRRIRNVEPQNNVQSDFDKNITDLMFAVSHGRVNIVKVLLEKGVDINAASADGITALMLAVIDGHIDIVKIWQKRGLI